MELLKKNIHMDRTRAETESQITLEDDLNIPESKPDVSSLNLEKGNIIIEEVKPGIDLIHVRGRLVFHILYHTMEEGSRLVSLEGKLPFEEKLHLQGATPADTVTVNGEAEDISIGIINSRKLSVQAVVTLTAKVEELYDEEVPIGLHGSETVEYRKMPMDLAQIAVSKNDIFRIKEEAPLPAGFPNIYQILWDSVNLGDMQFKAMEGKLSIQGELQIFILYEGEGENHPIRSFETVIPISGMLDCHGCGEGSFLDIGFGIGQQELTVRPDLDGEERSIGIEIALDMNIRIYEERREEILTDIYGVNREVNAITREANLRKLLTRMTGKTKLGERMRIESGSAAILQLLHSEGKVLPGTQSVVENGILMQGSLQIKVMYITGDDETPYASAQSVIPYQYTMEIPGITSEDMGQVQVRLEQLQVTMLDGEEMDVKAILSFSTTVFQNAPMELIGEIQVEELERGKLSSLPGMVIYVVREGDNLWNIGKKYYVTVDALKELNGLTGDEIRPGQKLLITKGV
ncbi:MAG: DUF3794 domain-containing protein [Roseburia sp.]|nr:DUF3794 domain-containing protein [Roseburia sp.]